MKVSELAGLVDGIIIGDPDIEITAAAGIKEASCGSVTFLGNSKYESMLERTGASCVLVNHGFDRAVPVTLIKVKDPSLAFSLVFKAFNPDLEVVQCGVHPAAVIDKTASIGINTSIGACAVIGRDVQIGDNCIIYPNVTIYPRSKIGNNVIIHAGTVIGSDGFGYATIDGIHKKIPQLGNVVIEDDVEIGANVTIDRARMDRTLIGKGAKIDNLVQIAHNAVIGAGAIVVAQVGISGSTKIGKYAILAGQVGVAGHLEIGDGAVVGAQGGVTKSLEGSQKYWGTPARPMAQCLREQAAISKLPELLRRVKELEKEIERLK